MAVDATADRSHTLRQPPCSLTPTTRHRQLRPALTTMTTTTSTSSTSMPQARAIARSWKCTASDHLTWWPLASSFQPMTYSCVLCAADTASLSLPCWRAVREATDDVRSPPADCDCRCECPRAPTPHHYQLQTSLCHAIRRARSSSRSRRARHLRHRSKANLAVSIAACTGTAATRSDGTQTF